MKSVRERLLALKQRKTQLINVDRLGPVVIQAPDENERAEIETAIGAATAKRLIVVKTVVECDPTGRELGEVWLADPLPKAFTAKDVQLLGPVDSTVINDITDAALELTKMSQEDQSTLLGESARS